MQNKRRMAFFGLTNLLIEFFLCPLRKHFWLTLSQAAAHRKLSFRQIQGMFIITHCGLNPNWSLVTVKY